MFRQFTNSDPARANDLFTKHPLEVAALVERVWFGRVVPPPLSAPFPANPYVRLPGNPFTGGEINQPFEHLIYAYMTENTRIYDIFRRVVFEFVQGEKLEIPSFAGQRWLRTTEELFFRDTPSFLSFTISSQLRPDVSATRRNNYYRMFGLDLNHGTEDNKPYSYTKPAAANRDFISTLELLLTEVWRGITNSANSSGAKDTDNDAIATLSLRLRDMLTVRRQNGNLSREEFWFTTIMSWLHLTVEYNSPIVLDLRADATSPEDRLKKIGERVGLPSHAKGQAFFLLADSMSRFLREIEAGAYSNSTTAQLLYNPPVQDNMIQIITQYSVATGRDIKARSVVLQKR